jgi:hypothetical protein
MWATLALTTALNLAPAQGALELKNVHLSYGPLGQERKDAAVLPGDILWVVFDIDGMKPGANDVIKYSMGTKLTDKNNKVIFEKEPEPLEAFNPLGGAHIPASANVTVGLDTTPGEYTFTVTVTDLTTKMAGSLSQKFEVVPLKFGMVRMGFHYPYPQGREGELPPAPPQGVAGQLYVLSFTLVGWEFDEKTKNPDVLAEVQIIDEGTGKSTLSQPIQGKVQNILEEFKKIKVLPMSFPLNLNRPGKFKLTFTATDKVTGKKVENSLNLTVVEIK